MSPARALDYLHGVLAIVALAHTVLAQRPTSPPLSAFAATLQARGYTAIPLTPAPYYGDGQYTVRVTLDTAPATLLLDSGFNRTLTIHRETADAAGVHGTSMGMGAGITGKVSLDTAHLHSFGIDALHFGPQLVYVGQFPAADGAIGSYFLWMHGAILDYTHDMLYLHVHPDTTVLPDALHRPEDVVIPLRRVNGKGDRAVYYVQAMVNGTPRRFLLDTGWGGAALNLDRERATAFGLRAPAHGTFTVGTITVDTDFTLVDLSQVRKKQVDVGLLPLDGVIGCGFLKAHGAIIDFADGVMYLRP